MAPRDLTFVHSLFPRREIVLWGAQSDTNCYFFVARDQDPMVITIIIGIDPYSLQIDPPPDTSRGN